jgi:hypothetical protein
MNETVKSPVDAFLEAKPRLNEVTDEYLTIKEVAARLKLRPKTIQNKMAAGVFRQGVHYFRPDGLGTRFKWSAVVKWIEGSGKSKTEDIDAAIPMARGYIMRGSA